MIPLFKSQGKTRPILLHSRFFYSNLKMTKCPTLAVREHVSDEHFSTSSAQNSHRKPRQHIPMCSAVVCIFHKTNTYIFSVIQRRYIHWNRMFIWCLQSSKLHLYTDSTDTLIITTRHSSYGNRSFITAACRRMHYNRQLRHSRATDGNDSVPDWSL